MKGGDTYKERDRQALTDVVSSAAPFVIDGCRGRGLY